MLPLAAKHNQREHRKGRGNHVGEEVEHLVRGIATKHFVASPKRGHFIYLMWRKIFSSLAYATKILSLKATILVVKIINKVTHSLIIEEHFIFLFSLVSNSKIKVVSTLEFSIFCHFENLYKVLLIRIERK